MITVTPESLGEGATQATVAQFERACAVALDIIPDIETEQEAIDYVWNEGQFDLTIAELLEEEIAF